MKIEKLPSGSYRIRQQIDGRRITVVLPYKPTKKEAAQLINDKRTGRDKLKLTFDQAAHEYIEGKRNTLSPSTIRGYESIRSVMRDVFRDKPLSDISSWDVQKYISDLSATRSPKTVANYNGFISAVLSTFCPDTILRVNLPQKEKKEVYLPTDKDIEMILDDVAGTEYEIPFKLACYGLRRSEILALTPDDLDGDVLTINKALVVDDKGKSHIKKTKTTDSARKIVIDMPLSAKIRAENRIFKGYPNQLYKKLQSVQKRLNITPFPLHAMRHYYASTAHAMGMPDQVIQASGGWKTDHVMKSVYRHEKKEQVEELQREYARKMSGHA